MSVSALRHTTSVPASTDDVGGTELEVGDLDLDALTGLARRRLGRSVVDDVGVLGVAVVGARA